MGILTSFTIADLKDLEDEIKAGYADYLKVPEKLSKPDTLITQFQLALKEKNKELIYSHHFYPVFGDYLDIQLSKPLYTRAFLFMDTLVKLIRIRGHSISFRNNQTFVKIKTEQIRIYLREKEKRVKRENPRYASEIHETIKTGQLTLKVQDHYSFRDFNDIKVPVEEQLARILAAIEVSAIRKAEYQAELEKRWAEQARRRNIEEEAKAIKEKEKTDFNELIENAKQFHEAQLMRNYIHEVEQRAINQSRLTGQLVEWIRWAFQKADEYDPTIQQKNF